MSSSASVDTAITTTPDTPGLVALLGEPRATIVRLLRDRGALSAGELADELGISDVAVRKHLAVLEDEGFIGAETVKQPRGRPVARYHLSDRARHLFPSRYAAMATELLDFIADKHGRDGLREYLQWRVDRETARLADEVTADGIEGRLAQLSEALTAAGYESTLSADGTSFELTQHHCAIYDVAEQHPEMCAYEAATFKAVLGEDVRLSRRETLATGGAACVCTVTPKGTPSARAGATELPIISTDAITTAPETTSKGSTGTRRTEDPRE